MGLLDEEAGIPAEDIRSQQIFDRIQDFRMTDHLVDPGKEHVATMAHLALDRSPGPRLVILQLPAKFGDFALAQCVDREMITTLAKARDLTLAQQFRHELPPVF